MPRAQHLNHYPKGTLPSKKEELVNTHKMQDSSFVQAGTDTSIFELPSLRWQITSNLCKRMPRLPDLLAPSRTDETLNCINLSFFQLLAFLITYLFVSWYYSFVYKLQFGPRYLGKNRTNWICRLIQNTNWLIWVTNYLSNDYLYRIEHKYTPTNFF